MTSSYSFSRKSRGKYEHDNRSRKSRQKYYKQQHNEQEYDEYDIDEILKDNLKLQKKVRNYQEKVEEL